MGVDYYNCERCGEIFADCGDFRNCNECGTRWCGSDCAEADGYVSPIIIDEDGEEMTDYENESCGYCRGEIEEMIGIPKKEYAQLLDDSRKLNALENGGVDNWSFYGEAMSEYYGNNGDEEDE